MALTHTPDHVRPTRRDPDPNRPTYGSSEGPYDLGGSGGVWLVIAETNPWTERPLDASIRSALPQYIHIIRHQATSSAENGLSRCSMIQWSN